MNGNKESDLERLKSQLNALMNAHFQRPSAEEKLRVVELADRQVVAEAEALDMGEDPHCERPGFEAKDQDQLAAQLIALINAHFQQPTPEETSTVLTCVSEQICSEAKMHEVEAASLVVENKAIV